MRRLLILSALALFAVAGTWAGTAAISDSLTVYSPTSVIVGQVGVYDDGSIFGFHAACTGPTCGVTEDSPNIYYIDLSGLTNYTNTTPNTMLLDSPSVGSDVFGQINLDAGFRLFFESNNGTVEFLPNSSYLLVPEGNGYADATAYLTADLRASGYTAQFYSVPDAAAPEPGTLLFLACGLLALACRWWWVYRTRSRAATVRERWLRTWLATAPDPGGSPVAARSGAARASTSVFS